MKKYLSYCLILTCFSACSVVSKQYNYEPGTAHKTIRKKAGYNKITSNQFDISDTTGKKIGSVATSNGFGTPMLMGPPYLPVLPIGVVTVFSKKLRQFSMDVTVRPDHGYFMTLAIDPDGYRRLNDSLLRLNLWRQAELHPAGCYMIVNGEKKVPLRVNEYFDGQSDAHQYRMYAPVTFGSVRTLTIVTGNPLLDGQLRNIVFKRKKRLAYCLLGLS